MPSLAVEDELDVRIKNAGIVGWPAVWRQLNTWTPHLRSPMAQLPPSPYERIVDVNVSSAALGRQIGKRGRAAQAPRTLDATVSKLASTFGPSQIRYPQGLYVRLNARVRDQIAGQRAGVRARWSRSPSLSRSPILSRMECSVRWFAR